MVKLFTVALIAGLVFESQSQPALIHSSSLGQKCWTEWFDRDNPSGTGDWEILSRLHIENPGKICPKPLGIQAETTSGLSVAAAGEVIYTSDTTTGFVCRNQDQPDKRCNDYRVRFSCHPPFCGGGDWPYHPTHIQCWTEWFDRDNPSGTGDWEILSHLYIENPGKICPKPLGIQAETTSGISVAAAGEVIYTSDTTTGFVCRNQDQPDKRCNDYRVRFSCHPPFCGGGVCWTNWFDRDDPSGTGDWETLNDLKKQYPGKICETPLYIEAVTTDTMTPAIQTGEVFLFYNPTQGFACRIQDQRDRRCRDYKVRFGCPCDCFPKRGEEEKAT